MRCNMRVIISKFEMPAVCFAASSSRTSTTLARVPVPDTEPLVKQALAVRKLDLQTQQERRIHLGTRPHLLTSLSVGSSLDG